MLRVLVALALTASGCARLAGLDDVHAVTGTDVDAAVDPAGDAAIDGPTPLCTGTIMNPADEGHAHMPDESAIEWNANPPTSGTHYDSWAAWDRTYTTQFKRGYWVHNLEHGGVVLLYNCTDCDAEVARLTAIINDQPTDSLCAAPVKRRMLAAPDPLLPAGVKFAAVAWNFSYTASCLNEPELRAFTAAHYGVDMFERTCKQGEFTP